MNGMAQLYLNPRDPPDLVAARGWLERAAAADAGNVDVMANLGDLHMRWMEPPDLDTARHWHERAANAGDSDAMDDLGVLHGKNQDPPDFDARAAGSSAPPTPDIPALR